MGLNLRMIALATAVLGNVATATEARPFSAEWQFSRGGACPQLCGDFGATAASAGAIAAPSNGDPNLYVCKAFVPGLEFYGERAGYNWNGSIGSNVQPGCTVVGNVNGAPGYTHVARNFWCLCEVQDVIDIGF